MEHFIKHVLLIKQPIDFNNKSFVKELKAGIEKTVVAVNTVASLLTSIYSHVEFKDSFEQIVRRYFDLTGEHDKANGTPSDYSLADKLIARYEELEDFNEWLKSWTREEIEILLVDNLPGSLENDIELATVVTVNILGSPTYLDLYDELAKQLEISAKTKVETWFNAYKEIWVS